MKRLLSWLAIAASTLVLLELALRAAHIGYPVFWGPDPKLGSVLRPGIQGWFRNEGVQWVTINSSGMHDREHAVAKPAGVFRIAAIGDSMTEAMQVPLDRNFCSVMERRLAGCAALGGKRPEVLNFGVSGYGTAQELIMLRERVWKYQPDLVLVAMFPGNDIRDNQQTLVRSEYNPYLTLHEGKIEIEDPPLPKEDALRRLRDVILDHSRVLQVIYQIRKNLRTRGADQMVTSDRDPKIYGEQGVDNAIFAPPKTAAQQDAWRLTEALLITIRDEARAHGAVLAVALIPSGIQDYPDPQVSAAFARRLGVSNLSYAQDRLAEFGRREDIEMIPLEQPMRAYAEAHHALLHGFSNRVLGFGHLNESGHAEAGELLAAAICGHS